MFLLTLSHIIFFKCGIIYCFYIFVVFFILLLLFYMFIFIHFLLLISSVVILFILLTKPVFTYIISDHFFEGWKYIGLLLVGSLFHTCALFWSAGYHGAKKTDVIFITSVIGAVVN